MDPLGSLILWVAPMGLAGLLAVGAMERLVPVLPSYGLLVAIGIGAADGLWPVVPAILAVTLGSTASSLVCYALAAAPSRTGSERFLGWNARLIGLPPVRLVHWIDTYRRHQGPIAVGSQLVPTVRLLTPAIAGLLRADLRVFIPASTAGIAVWNSLFIALGSLVAGVADDPNASVLALQLLSGLIALELVAVFFWRRVRGATAAVSIHHPKDHAS